MILISLSFLQRYYFYFQNIWQYTYLRIVKLMLREYRPFYLFFWLNSNVIKLVYNHYLSRTSIIDMSKSLYVLNSVDEQNFAGHSKEPKRYQHGACTFSEVSTISLEHIRANNNIIIYWTAFNCHFNKKDFPHNFVLIERKTIP